MEMQHDNVGDVRKVVLVGRLDTAGVDLVETKFGAAIVPNGKNTIVDLTQVTFLASMGIRMLISTTRALSRKGGKLVMVGLYGGANPISTVLFPFKMMTIEGSYVGTIEDLRELLALVQAGKVPPIPIETRPAGEASAALSDLKSGGKVRGRVVLHHQ